MNHADRTRTTTQILLRSGVFIKRAAFLSYPNLGLRGDMQGDASEEQVGDAC